MCTVLVVCEIRQLILCKLTYQEGTLWGFRELILQYTGLGKNALMRSLESLHGLGPSSPKDHFYPI